MTAAVPERSAPRRASWSRALAAYRDGAQVVQRLGSKFVDWTLPTPCAGWSAIDLVGHLLCVARTQHRLLDAAVAGHPRSGLPCGASLDARNADELAALPVAAGSDRVVAFDAVTTRYGERLAEADPDLPMGEWDRLGWLDLHDHTLAAAVELHVHAWDLAATLGWDHRPADPDALDPEGWRPLLDRFGRPRPARPRPLGP
jgi:uncharacterized protein (TIGR03083 family)